MDKIKNLNDLKFCLTETQSPDTYQQTDTKKPTTDVISTL
jgi:hypothetical protein